MRCSNAMRAAKLGFTEASSVVLEIFGNEHLKNDGEETALDRYDTGRL
tara:strand:- start:447 stop:590 length:144 start_codon:yes stop_codon:yes gene_type:complete